MENNEKAGEESPKIESKKRKKKEIALFGNYKFYYTYRISRDVEEDPRFAALKKEWFEGKDCLDIGCNSGLITINIAKKFFCRSILGIDIDADRVEDAKWNLRRIVNMERACSRSSNTSRLKHPERVNGLEHRLTASLDEETTNLPRDSSPPEGRNLSDRISFREENFVKSWHEFPEKYDTILCLSVTKWVHLNWGDEGLITLFAEIWRLLRPGGILVLEPQGWHSYCKNRQVSETSTFNYRNIMLRPGLFQEILLNEIGFRTVENITARLSGSTTGFDRPIFVFRK